MNKYVMHLFRMKRRNKVSDTFFSLFPDTFFASLPVSVVSDDRCQLPKCRRFSRSRPPAVLRETGPWQ